ncbi:MAG: phosphoribosylglycinamide formyltransferase [Clostridiales bacterium]|nr:phosphoribosylglycinamide formyltransferase [Clostridiales bacterium]
MVNTAVLVSGGGTNLQAILDALHFGEIKNCKIVEVISSSPDAYALARAENAGIPHRVIDIRQHSNRFVYTDAIIDRLRAIDAELVVLAGFMYVLSPRLTELFKNRVINVHPALIPSFCGSGFYGLRVHKSALEYGVKVTGATVHFATAQADAGPIILQQAVEVLEDDTPETLQRRVMEEAEHKILPKAISLYCEGRLVVEGRNVRILGEEPKWIL